MAKLEYTITRSGWDTWQADVTINYTVSYDKDTNKSTVTFASSSLSYWGQNGFGSSSETAITVTAGDNTSSKKTATLTTSGNTRMEGQTYSSTPSPVSVTVQHSSGTGAKTVKISANSTVSGYFLSPSGQYNVSGSGSKTQTVATVYTLSISAGTGSTVTVKRGSTTLNDGDTVLAGDALTVTFGAATGYNLNTHTVNGSSFTSGSTHTVAGNVAVKATAKVKSFTLSVSETGAAVTVNRTSSPKQGAATGTVKNGATIYHGDVLKISASAATGYQNVTIKVNGSTFTSGSTHTVSAAVSVIATAAVKSFTLDISAGLGSTVTVNRTSSPKQGAATGTLSDGATVYHGDTLKVTFGADTGYTLATHTVNGSTVDSGSVHTVSAKVTVAATATAKTYKLTISAGTGATVTVKSGSTTYKNGDMVAYGQTLQIGFAAQSGYNLATHTVNGVTRPDGYFHTVTGAVTVAATATAAASTISSCPSSIETEQTLTLGVTRSSASYRHKATFKCDSRTLKTTSLFDTQTSFEVPRTWFADYASSTSLTVTVSVQTYLADGTTAVGSPDTKTVTVKADSGMKPTLQSDFASVEPDNSGYSWEETVTGYVQGYSKAAVTMTKSKVTMAEGATLASYKVTCQGKTQTVTSPGATATVTTAVLTGAAATAIKVTVTDSRGRTASTTLTVTPMAYAKPTLSGVTASRCDSGGAETDGGTHFKVTATGTCSALDGQNEVTLTSRRYSADRSRSWSSVNLGSGEPPISVQGRVLGGTLVENDSYILRITATDLLGNATYTEIKLPGLRWAMKFRPGGTGVGFGMAPSRDKVLQIPDDWDVLIGQLGLVYRAGDSITFGTGSYVQLPGGFRANNRLQFTIPLSKPIVSGVTASVSGKIVLYRDGTFATITIGTGNSAETFLSASGVSVRLTFTDVPSFYSAHSWCGVQAYGLTVSFT